ncbi:hypothetical protein [Pseudalkalibacillus berkeleyi]|uniref:Lipopolysaccharide assembly protein A domain-containing protein n=1 Tax=Pseudalkalibacillus berkeleyi TaxID=1069813 RepID=A0ABS9H562_9BACL|nr:hypothetical protein [Pseudalkalibacillus berkeleyi]MCF6139064.1 hypothetical protein [Pseudalkalibacillus berkeleyi]
MVRLGSYVVILSLVLLVVAYMGFISSIQISFLEDQASILLVIAIAIGFIGALILIIGVFRDRLREKKEEENNDYSKY